MADKTRLDLASYSLPKSAQGKTFFDKSPGYVRLRRAFRQLVEDPGLGVLTADRRPPTAEPGVGKTAALRNLCADLPRPDHLVMYLCDTTVSPLDLYRSLADQHGVRPSHRRGQPWPISMGDSNLYIRRLKDALVLTIEHRAAAAPDPLRLQLVAGDDADVHLAVVATPAELDVPRDLDPLVLDALGRAGRALSRSQLRVELRVRNERLGDALVRLAATGALVRAGDRWAVPVPTPQEERDLRHRRALRHGQELSKGLPKGYATEALEAALRWGDAHFGDARTVGPISPDNAPSLTVAENLGYREMLRTTMGGEPDILFARYPHPRARVGPP